tara:strand:+ start:44 stop:256 length:213 start_codon:yes stop_codon:yes gene_type:complete
MNPKDPNLEVPPADDVKRYNLYELQTTGWEPAIIDGEQCINLTKEISKHYTQILLDSGTAPDRIKVKRVV